MNKIEIIEVFMATTKGYVLTNIPQNLKGLESSKNLPDPSII